MNLQSKHLKSRSKKEQLIDNDIQELANEITSVSASVPVDASSLSYDGTTSGLAATDVQAAIDEVQANIDALPAAPTTTVVNISSAQIKAGLGTIGIDLLPAPGANKYYEYSIRFEYYHGLVDYSWGMSKIEIVNTNQFISADLLTGRAGGYAFISSYTEASSDNMVLPISELALNTPLKIKGSVGSVTNPTLGDGTLRAIITYTVRTFGS